MKTTYKIMEFDVCSPKILAEFVIDDDDVVGHSVHHPMDSNSKVVIAMEGVEDFIIDFKRRVAIEKVEDIIEDFSETYTVSISDELREQIMNDLLDRGVEYSVARDVVASVDYTDAEIDVTVSVRDMDVVIDRIHD